MQKLYILLQTALCVCIFYPKISSGQDCSGLTASFTTFESRCAATGSIKVIASGGSGSYKYKTQGPVNSNFTTTDSITGLSAGVYTVVVNDVVTNCTYTKNNIVVSGAYQDPRFTLSKVDVSCDLGNNGSVTVTGQQYGRSPFTYSIFAPSASGVGTTNGTGIFNNLIAGDYNIRMTDSCGGIQTRQITVVGYTWWIDTYVFNKIACDSASGSIKVEDSRGNISTVGGIPGFAYGIVRQPGDTVWSAVPNFTFNTGGFNSFKIIAKDACGKIKVISGSLNLTPSVDAAVNIYARTCGSFSASLNNIANFLNGGFCLYNSSNTLVTCNSTGVFTNIPYGDYCIKAHDACTDTTITRCFNAAAPLISVDDNVAIDNKTCFTFSARITGQIGLTNASFCLYDSSNVPVICNSTGIFDNLTYGNYCIKITDGCRDTTITRCFVPNKPRPIVNYLLIPKYYTCTNFGIVTGGDSLTNPQYCLYNNGVLIECNYTGVFDSIPFGSYCIDVHDACYDTIFTRCFTVDGPPGIINDVVVTTLNRACSTFSITATSVQLILPDYCLYTSDSTLIACNKTGIFDNLPYGSYCLQSRNSCPDTVVVNCFSASPPVPLVDDSVALSDKSCTTFTAKTTGQQNLTNPQYCIFDSNDVQLSCNSTGDFYNLAYGDYCIKVVNSCFDTTITRCFTASPDSVDITASSNKSCTYGYAKLTISITGESLPVTINIYNPAGYLFFTRNYNNSKIIIDSIPGLIPGETYKIVTTDLCGKTDSVRVSATSSYLTHSPAVIAKCPGGTSVNGSGNIQLTAATNMGSLTVRIIKKNGVKLSTPLSPNTVSAGVYTFNDLGPATYIVSYKANDQCKKTLYDTVVVQPYQYPNLDRSSAYQCDVDGFSIGAVVSNGVGPYSYSVIGSSPSSPSIVAGPQLSPIFNVDNGTTYSLVRLRALDACGNATLGDASILPLANNGIVATMNCLLQPATLKVDTIYNSTYQWYKKTDINSTDSTFLGSGFSLYIPYVSPSDTGLYVCHITVNSGCIKKSYYYNLNADCYVVLPETLLDFKGEFMDDKVLLNWNTSQEYNLKSFIIERKNSDNTFTEIGKSDAIGNSRLQKYNFIDPTPAADKNFYRLKLINYNNNFTYSNIIVLSKNSINKNIQIYPNPISNMLNINFDISKKHLYKISLFTSDVHLIKEITFNTNYSNKLQIPRTKDMVRGFYIVRFIDLNNNEEFSQKVTFR